jgi:hypothetical protein
MAPCRCHQPRRAAPAQARPLQLLDTPQPWAARLKASRPLPSLAAARAQGEGVPFAHAAARFPAVQQLPTAPTFLDRHEHNPPHIPAHLPAFPDAHTYQATPAFQGHETDTLRQRQAVLAGKQQAEAALVKLHQRLQAAAAGGKGAGAAADGAGAAGAAAAAAENPFLAPPAVVDAAAEPGPAPAAAAAAAGGAGSEDGLAGLDFDTGAARAVFRSVLAPGAGGGTSAMDEDGGGGAPGAGAEPSVVMWAPDAPLSGDAGGDAGATRRQELMQLQWHDPAKAASVLGAAAPSKPPDAYQERAEALMAAEGAGGGGGGGGRQRKSAYGRANAELQRADELLRAGHGGVGGGGGGGLAGLLDDDDL